MEGWRRSSLATLVGAVAMAACADGASEGAGAGLEVEGGPAAVESFEGSAPSLQALGQHVLAALVAGDTLALERVRLTEREHNEVVWPELPASRPEVGFPLDYAWMNIQNRNHRSLERIVPRYAGRDPELRLVDCRGDTQRFDTFQVLTDCWLVFALGERDALYEAQVFKDVLARGGGYKIVRYYDEEPRRAPGEG